MDLIVGGFKTFFYILGVYLFQRLNLPGEMLVSLAFLMIVDLISGVFKQFTINPENITSVKMWFGTIKKIMTFLCLLSIAILFRNLSEIFDFEATRKYIITIIGVLMVNEVYSILGNTYTIRTGKAVKEYDIISIVIKRLGDVLGKILIFFDKRLEDWLKDKGI